MTFIRTISPEEATGLLKELYDHDQNTLGFVANYTRALSLHPEILSAWRNLTRQIRARMDERRYELITTAASVALRCTY
jgi:alkylhydroperoxidase/carboxymuconolactone decarboxylase family protein YurZ